MWAGLSHHVSAQRLRRLSQSQSIPKVVLVTGDKDNLVPPRNTLYLKENMLEDAEVVWFENTGHAFHFQRHGEFNAVLERVFREGRERIYSQELY